MGEGFAKTRGWMLQAGVGQNAEWDPRKLSGVHGELSNFSVLNVDNIIHTPESNL